MVGSVFKIWSDPDQVLKKGRIWFSKYDRIRIRSKEKPKDVFQKLDPNPGKIQPESQGLLVPEETS